MRFKTATSMPDSQSTVRHSHTSSRPQWLRDWLENKGRYVILACGHKEDLNDKALLVIWVFGQHGKGVDVMCEWCNRFVEVKAPWKSPPTIQEEMPLY